MTITRRELMYIGAAATATVGLRGAKAQASAGFAESQDGGYFSNFGNAGFIWSHGCASDVHTSTCGLNQLGSSKLAVLIATNWGDRVGLDHNRRAAVRTKAPTGLATHLTGRGMEA